MSQLINSIGPEISEPTEKEIEATLEQLKTKYDIFISKAEAVKVIKLNQELRWWEAFRPEALLSKPIPENTVLWLQEVVKNNSGEELSVAAVYDNAEPLIQKLPEVETERIKGKIREILIPHREVLRDPIVEEKTRNYFRLRYKIELSDNQLGQLIPNLSRSLWYIEGLDSSLEECLNKLLRSQADDDSCREFVEAMDLIAKNIKRSANDN